MKEGLLSSPSIAEGLVIPDGYWRRQSKCSSTSGHWQAACVLTDETHVDIGRCNCIQWAENMRDDMKRKWKYVGEQKKLYGGKSGKA